MTYLAAPIRVENIDQTCQAAQQVIRAGAEMLELRLDYLNDPTPDSVTEIVTTISKLGVPIIATCRPSWEGGQFTGNESHRQNLIKKALTAGVDFADLEAACFNQPDFSLDDLLASTNAKTIVSHHDFNQLPADLEKKWAQIQKCKPFVAKIAYQSHNINDNFAALDLLFREKKQGNQAIILAMGSAGVFSRLLAKKLGAFLTFASVDESTETAPGQLSIEQIKNTFRWDHLNAQTTLFGVIGYPIAHSMSPVVHNAAFDQNNFNGLYLPLLVEPTWNDFRSFLDNLRRREWLNFAGISVTIPHKQNARDYILQNQGYIEPLADKLRAVNTILFDSDGKISGYNTDYAGALDAITTALNADRSALKGIPTAIVGAGGVARALVGGLTDCGARVTIYNRTLEKARQLAQEFDCDYAPFAKLTSLQAQLIVNATSIGMHPLTAQSILTPDQIKPNMLVFDTVYNPARTLLLKYAEQAGAPTIDGAGMFINQAAAQFEMFTRQTAPRQKMRQIIQKHLA